MKSINKTLLLIIITFVSLIQMACTDTKSYNLREIQNPEKLFLRENIDSLMHHVLDWQLNHYA